VINGELTLRILTEISTYSHEFLDLRNLIIFSISLVTCKRNWGWGRRGDTVGKWISYHASFWTITSGYIPFVRKGILFSVIVQWYKLEQKFTCDHSASIIVLGIDGP
jgi:hypothetical protein